MKHVFFEAPGMRGIMYFYYNKTCDTLHCHDCQFSGILCYIVVIYMVPPRTDHSQTWHSQLVFAPEVFHQEESLPIPKNRQLSVQLVA